MSEKRIGEGRGPDSFTLAVLMEARPSSNPWVDQHWSAVGVVVNSQLETDGRPLDLVRGDVRQQLWPGLTLQLYKDEAESYYHNLTVPQPLLFVICDQAEDGTPRPVGVSASFDEANAHVETADEVFSLPLPAELYGWLEAFVLEYYVPERRVKRKRQPWKESQGG